MEKNIRSGFRKTRIWPFNPARILDDREAIIGDLPSPLSRSLTPTFLPITLATVLQTPTRSRNIYNSLQNALQYNSLSLRNVQSLLIKVGEGSR